MDGTIPEVPLVADAGNCLARGAIPGQQVGHLDLWMDSLPVTYIETSMGYGGGKGINMMRITAMKSRIAETDAAQDRIKMQPTAPQGPSHAYISWASSTR